MDIRPAEWRSELGAQRRFRPPALWLEKVVQMPTLPSKTRRVAILHAASTWQGLSHATVRTLSAFAQGERTTWLLPTSEIQLRGVWNVAREVFS